MFTSESNPTASGWGTQKETSGTRATRHRSTGRCTWFHGMFETTALYTCVIFIITLSVVAGTFRDEQMRFPRVRKAHANARPLIDSIYDVISVNRDSLRLFIRVHKYEKEVELWLGHPDATMHLAKTYNFTAFSGVLGPKRAEGDLQIPEGVYYIDRFNPSSSYHLSLGINYPNRSDRIRAAGSDPGCDIFIHGNRVTIGCIPIGDGFIEELYTICVDARTAGQLRIPVHIFPCRMLSARGSTVMSNRSKSDQTLHSFWDELKPVYEGFQSNQRVPAVRVDGNGKYYAGD